VRPSTEETSWIAGCKTAELSVKLRKAKEEHCLPRIPGSDQSGAVIRRLHWDDNAHIRRNDRSHIPTNFILKFGVEISSSCRVNYQPKLMLTTVYVRVLPLSASVLDAGYFIVGRASLPRSRTSLTA
jgi:hypothetical protein